MTPLARLIPLVTQMNSGKLLFVADLIIEIISRSWWKAVSNAAAEGCPPRSEWYGFLLRKS